MRRRRSILTIACACAILAGDVTQAAAVHNSATNVGSSLPSIAVLVYNYAAVAADTMTRAREKVDRQYREAGVEIEWLDPLATSRYRFSPTSNPSHSFTVQILIRSMRVPRGPSTPQSVMGEALPADETGGTLSVFYDQVVRVARQYGQPLPDILGLAIAHEMGHLLLPDHAHSSTGIMRADWGGDDIRHGVDGSLAFTAAQAVLIRAKISLLGMHVAAQGQPRTGNEQANIEGIWLNDTATPLARPPEFADHAFFSEAEAHAFEAHYLTDRIRAINGALEAEVSGDILEPGHVLPSRRTSLIVDPPDGKVPPLTPDAMARAAARALHRREHFADGPEDLPLSERCLVPIFAGPPLMPGPYNNNVQIVQTSDYVMILHEMMHEVRVIPLTDRPHLPSHIRQWKGDGRGHWDGGTLVVDSTNFSDQTTFNGSGQSLHVIERFTRVDANTLRYEFTIDDPASFTSVWSASSLLSKTTGPIFEYACHEGNYSLVNTLRGARFAEKSR
jgi:hypothetical protein